MKKACDKVLKYALDKDNRLVYIDSVPNGLNCGCICPHCHKELIAKNNGQERESHFAHVGKVCSAYYETTLHLLSKEIIKDGMTVMLPAFKSLVPKKIHFKEVEIEERRDASSLQPDCVGVTDDGLRIHIEIFVTHKVDESKKEKIVRCGINSLEIRVPNDFPQDREKLRDFIENRDDGRGWINYPLGEEIIKKEAQMVGQKRARWYMENAKEWLRTPSECDRCSLNQFKMDPWLLCQYRLEDIEYEGEKRIVCKNMFYFHDNHKDGGLIPTKDSSGKLARCVDKEEQKLWDIANGICPICGNRVGKRRDGEYGVLWCCQSYPSCKWVCRWE